MKTECWIKKPCSDWQHLCTFFSSRRARSWLRLQCFKGPIGTRAKLIKETNDLFLQGLLGGYGAWTPELEKELKNWLSAHLLASNQNLESRLKDTESYARKLEQEVHFLREIVDK